jgi:predicted DNA-binding protein (MmcQ/YjbR family)
MNKEELREYCLSMNEASEHFPFDEVILVFKIRGKWFAVLQLDAEDTCISMKCDPERAIELREKYADVKPAYHFNKKHWNTVYTENSVPDKLVKELIKHSYDLVLKKIPRLKK